MSKRGGITSNAELRKRAEARVDALAKARPRMSIEEEQRLRHELEGDQIELEMQNEELGAALQREIVDLAGVARDALDDQREELGAVELHGGIVSVESDGPGCGATFAVQLPLSPAPRVAATPDAKPTCEHHRVLVIEDSVEACDSLKQLLELDGHEVESAYDGRSGIERAHAFHPDVILCDIGLPGMDGYEVARAIRDDRELKGAYLVALSGYARPEDRKRAAEAGFDRHVAKPPSIEEIEDVISEAHH